MKAEGASRSQYVLGPLNHDDVHGALCDISDYAQLVVSAGQRKYWEIPVTYQAAAGSAGRASPCGSSQRQLAMQYRAVRSVGQDGCP